LPVAVHYPLFYSVGFLHFFLSSSAALRDLHSFPTRRSSDLPGLGDPEDPLLPELGAVAAQVGDELAQDVGGLLRTGVAIHLGRQDRKSTRLNSSHLGISYAVFCLKKKKKHRVDAVCDVRSRG